MIYPNTQNRNLEEKERLYLLPNGKSIPITNLVTDFKGIAEIERENLQMMCVTGRLDNKI
jgi:hypothetical protein